MRDLVELRKLLPGLPTTITDGPSWIFVPKQHQFTGDQPWPFPEALEFTIQYLRQSADFNGVKLGDVNFSFDNGQKDITIAMVSPRLP